MKNFVQSIVALVALGPALDCAAGMSSFRTMEEAVHEQLSESNLGEGIRLLSKEELADERIARKKRMRERRERARELLNKLPPPQQAEKMSSDDVERHLGWFGGSSYVSGTAYSSQVLVDPSAEYDKWAQAYRMLGGYIDCDHPKEDDHHSGSGDNNNNNNGDSNACSRWMIWAAYVNPNYQGYEYNEYFGDNPPGKLDCHSPETEWQLLGVYRQEFYQYIEQISKHLWAIDDYEYVVALAGLAYMTDEDCYQVGNDGNGNPVYAGVAPQPYGTFKMAVYSDEYCLEPDNSMGVSFDSYGLQNDIDLGSKDATDDGKEWAYDWWYDTQEENLEQLNDVYDTFRYCTSCVDYPTYQDGYFIGDYGTDDDDLINQCWKFWSHDSYVCEADCLATADAQGGILTVSYGGITFGAASSDYWSKVTSQSSATVAESSLTRLLANAFLTLSFLLFVATFLAFAVARRSRYRESRSGRSRRLLDDDRSRRSRRKSRTRGGADEGDGIFKEKSQSRSRSKRSSSRSSRRSSSRAGARSKSYEAPSRKSAPADDEY
uniref:Uncharacterized protein n=1 Tax=Amphora coffeiformis TaxID=265554 RepID=A0A7S3LIE7_9STRA|mmetsp:Transcript_24109/g.45846  ORF Transcript_24109/g.45846 Transcript_24109/m.45846 type:complete len:547 (+) Transcript_24109:213-1853(+)|eukprot:scaffold2782_cov182-Amphora_coffeaeformis.AAC.23